MVKVIGNWVSWRTELSYNNRSVVILFNFECAMPTPSGANKGGGAFAPVNSLRGATLMVRVIPCPLDKELNVPFYTQWRIWGGFGFSSTHLIQAMPGWVLGSKLPKLVKVSPSITECKYVLIKLLFQILINTINKIPEIIECSMPTYLSQRNP